MQVIVHCRFDREDLAQLDKYAKRSGRSRSEIIRESVNREIRERTVGEQEARTVVAEFAAGLRQLTSLVETQGAALKMLSAASICSAALLRDDFEKDQAKVGKLIDGHLRAALQAAAGVLEIADGVLPKAPGLL